MINIDFADIQTILKGRGKLAFLNTAQAVGKTGAEEIIKNIFNNPLYNYNLIAEKILFNISGGSNLSMVDVEKISKNIANLNPKAKIIFGISRSSKSKNRIKATLLVTGPSHLTQSSSFGKSRDKKLEKEEKPVPKKKVVEEKKVQKKKKPPVSPSKTPDTGKKPKKEAISIKPKTDKAVPVTTPAPLPETSLKTEQKTEGKRRAKIRRSALEIKKAEEIEEGKKWAQEKEWEIPAFLRRIKGQHSTN